MRRTLCLLVTLVLLSACATGGAVYVPYDPNRCDRSGDEHQRRAC